MAQMGQKPKIDQLSGFIRPTNLIPPRFFGRRETDMSRYLHLH
jgi:hypothetical protein